MIGRWIAPTGKRDAESAPRDSFFECTNCRADYDEWVEDCPACGQLVARFVEPPD